LIDPRPKRWQKKCYNLPSFKKKDQFKPHREKDVLSIAIGSKEHGGYVRGLSSKLSIKDGFEKDGLGTAAMTTIKKKSWQQQRMQCKQSSRICSWQHLRSSSSRGYLCSTRRKRWGSNNGGHAASGTWPSESSMCTEQCCLDHSSTIPGGYHNEYYSLLVCSIR
jgi:hypothetical protein